MTFQEAINTASKIIEQQGVSWFDEADIEYATFIERTAIATILNAVVKGELK